jgi:hypothetical protein
VAGVKGRSGHDGPKGIDPQNPIRIFKTPYRAEKAEGKGKDLYFDDQSAMIKALKGNSSYTPMKWSQDKKMYIIDWKSATLLEL